MGVVIAIERGGLSALGCMLVVVVVVALRIGALLRIGVVTAAGAGAGVRVRLTLGGVDVLRSCSIHSQHRDSHIHAIA